MFEEPEDPTNRSFFSEIISSISDVKFSNSGRYMISRDYLSVKVWDLHMETKPVETYTVRMASSRSLNGSLHCRFSLFAGSRVPSFQAVFTVRERLHFRQVRVLLERQRQRHHDRLVQQLLPNVRPQLKEGGDLRGVQGDRQAQDAIKTKKGKTHRRCTCAKLRRYVECHFPSTRFFRADPVPN